MLDVHRASEAGMWETSSSRLLRSAAYFPVPDVDRSVDHYERVFGFRREYVAGSPAEFAILSRDGLPIMLRRVAASLTLAPNESQGGTWDVFFWVSDAKALHAELASRGAEVTYGPMIQRSYGMEEFAVRDVDGYVLGFGQAIES